MLESSVIQMYEQYIPKEEFTSIVKVAIKYKEVKFLKILSYFKIFWFKRYYLKVSYNNKSTKLISISPEEKEILKNTIMDFNFYLSTLR